MSHEFEDTNLEIYRPIDGENYIPYLKADKNSTISELVRFRFVGSIGIVWHN